MAGTEKEKQSYSALERMMFLMTPILFAIVLLGVLFTLFNNDFRNKMLTAGNSIPVLKDVLPEPKVAGGSINDDELKTSNMSAKIADLQAQLTAIESELAAANQTKSSLEQEVKDLESDNSQLKSSNESDALEDEQYQVKIQELASMFSKITPSKAAPILQSMTLDEMVLVFANMRPDDRVRIMEKMNPQTAANAAMKLKDNVTAKDMQIAALQARLESEKTEVAKPASSVLDQEQLSATFTAMDAKSAGELLVKMVDVSPSKVLRILNAVDNETRSSILAEMSGIDEKVTAQLVTKLMSGS
ncbi:flagellar motility protein MotE (MotC chaperone) [Paenibacillus endophyticus]|uniref:Flagellar motility protein MotE (MotC chaperone) n=1 Tax=Paenibacillus endophyticus TaxID=1294268 RepID=A0A7W5GA96_9BACL|nr:MgtE protein [Paenibacillus endophyticus]MBB3152108.1 flagellar motility protein MotE (MotC chaperone) [Paenibacillus endophyticus]